MSAEQRLRETLDAFAARVREDLDARAQTLAAELTRAVQEADGAVRADSERALAAERQQLDHQLAEERRQLEERLAGERAALAALREQNEEAHRDQTVASPMPRLLDAVRRLDAAPSLTSILGVLGQAIHARVSRTVVFVVDGEALKSWGEYGFDAGPTVTDLSVHDARIVSSALATQMSSTFRAADVAGDSATPEFLRPPADHLGLMMPLSVGGDVVALVYADGPEVGPGAQADGARTSWVDEVELIARYGRARLESVTSERTVSALTRMA